MKHKIYIPALACIGLLAASCQDDMETFPNKVFSPTVNPVSSILVQEGTTDAIGYVSAKMAKKENYDVNITFGVMADKVDAYNSIYSQEAELLPEGYYTIPQPTATITAGLVATDNVAVDFINLANLDMDKLYVLPVGILSAPFATMDNDVTYFVIREAAIINVVADMTKTAATFKSTEAEAYQLSGLTQITVEVLLYPQSFPNMLATVMGKEGYFLVRIGDAGIEPNQLQLATSNGNVTDEAWRFDTNKWTFLTFTYDTATGETKVYFDGVQKGSTQYGNFLSAIDWNSGTGPFTDGSNSYFYVGFAWNADRWFPGYMSELRVWNRVLTQDEINAPLHFYTVDADSEGLVAYWKLNEGAGNEFKDSANGYDLVCMPNDDKDVTRPGWVEVSLPEKSK